MDSIKVFAKNKKGTEDPDTSNKNIQPGYRNEIWHWKMSNAHNEKCELRNNRINRNQENIRTLGAKENYKYFQILEANSINKQRWRKKNKKASWNQGVQQKSHPKDQHLGSPSYKIRDHS